VDTELNAKPGPASAQAQQIYDHLLQCAQSIPPQEMIEKFRHLFLEAISYENPQIARILQQIALSKQAEQEFRYILNRSFYILINTWQHNPHHQAAIPELIALLDQPIHMGATSARGVRRVRELIRDFGETEQYHTLRRLSQVLKHTATDALEQNLPVGNLIQRYPYLYDHCLLSEDSDYEQKMMVRDIQERIQQKFETDLSHYVTYQVRRAHQAATGSNRMLEVVENPTLLSDRELAASLKQYTGKVHSGQTYRDVAQSFTAHAEHTKTFRAFKEDFYSYLTTAIDPAYGKRSFNNNLYEYLMGISTQNDQKKPDEFMVMRTCSQTLNYLVVESQQKPNHFVFVDLITNLGATYTIGLLLKIVLLCSKVKPYLEKRFAILFNHYETSSKDGVPWLIKSLENLNVAFSIHFGRADVSCLSHIMQRG